MGEHYTLLLSIFYLAGGVFIFLLGLTILRSGRSSAPSRATALILFFAGVGPILSASSIILQGTLRQDVVVFRSMVENFEYLWEFYFPSLLLFSLLYPREQRFASNTLLVGLVVFAPYLFHLVTIMAGDSLSDSFMDASKRLPLSKEFSVGERTFSLSGFGNIVSAVLTTLVKLHRQLFLLVNVLYATVALVFLFSGMRLHINPRVTGPLRTVLLGLTVSVCGYVLAKIVGALPGRSGTDNLSLALINFSLVAGGGSVAYAVVKQQFLGIRYVTRKSILYGAAALLFAGMYLVVVKPVSDFFGQYSLVSKDAFETGFIILAIIAFQPMLTRIEDVLERLLLKGREDLQSKFKKLGSDISSVTNRGELDGLLQNRFREILDATSVQLNVDNGQPQFDEVMGVLARIGEPIRRHEILKLGEQGRLLERPDDEPKVLERQQRKQRAREGLEAARRLAGDTEVFVPILKDRECVGYVTLGEKTYGVRYGPEELALMSMMSDHLGAALDRIRLLRDNVEKKVLEEELQMARRIQSQLLPSGPPTLIGYQLTASTVPSRQVGGDYYDFELLDDGSLAIVIADVSGKGIPASLLMATLRAAVNSNQDVNRKPALMLQRINTLLYGSTSPEEFATVFYGVVDLHSGQVKYANAGHEFPFVVCREGLRTLGESGIVLGCMLDYTYEEKESVIPPGGSLILYTDGITDASTSTGENFGESRLRQTIEGASDEDSDGLCRAILDRVGDFSRGGDYQDDLTLVVLKRE